MTATPPPRPETPPPAAPTTSSRQHVLGPKEYLELLDEADKIITDGVDAALQRSDALCYMTRQHSDPVHQQPLMSKSVAVVQSHSGSIAPMTQKERLARAVATNYALRDRIKALAGELKKRGVTPAKTIQMVEDRNALDAVLRKDQIVSDFKRKQQLEAAAGAEGADADDDLASSAAPSELMPLSQHAPDVSMVTGSGAMASSGTQTDITLVETIKAHRPKPRSELKYEPLSTREIRDRTVAGLSCYRMKGIGGPDGGGLKASRVQVTRKDIVFGVEGAERIRLDVVKSVMVGQSTKYFESLAVRLQEGFPARFGTPYQTEGLDVSSPEKLVNHYYGTVTIEWKATSAEMKAAAASSADQPTPVGLTNFAVLIFTNVDNFNCFVSHVQDYRRHIKIGFTSALDLMNKSFAGRFAAALRQMSAQERKLCSTCNISPVKFMTAKSHLLSLDAPPLMTPKDLMAVVDLPMFQLRWILTFFEAKHDISLHLLYAPTGSAQ